MACMIGEDCRQHGMNVRCTKWRLRRIRDTSLSSNTLRLIRRMSLLPRCPIVIRLCMSCTHARFDGGVMLRYPLSLLPFSRMLISVSYLDAGVKRRKKTGRDPLSLSSLSVLDISHWDTADGSQHMPHGEMLQ